MLIVVAAFILGFTVGLAVLRLAQDYTETRARLASQARLMAHWDPEASWD